MSEQGMTVITIGAAELSGREELVTRAFHHSRPDMPADFDWHVSKEGTVRRSAAPDRASAGKPSRKAPAPSMSQTASS